MTEKTPQDTIRMTDTERALARALAALRAVLPYAESRAEDMQEDMEFPALTSRDLAGNDLADRAREAVEDAQQVLAELENRGFPKIGPARLDEVVARVNAGLGG